MNTVLERERFDAIETRNAMARAVLDVLLMALDSEGPPTADIIERTISAASELLAVE